MTRRDGLRSSSTVRQPRHGRGDALGRNRAAVSMEMIARIVRLNSCRRFLELTGYHGAALSPSTRSRKHVQARGAR